MIYAIKALETDFVKFGLTGHQDVKTRLAELQVGCPFELYLIAQVEWPDQAEATIHRYLAPFNIRGEWFTTNSEVPNVYLVHAVIEYIKAGYAYEAFFKMIAETTAQRLRHRRLGKALEMGT